MASTDPIRDRQMKIRWKRLSIYVEPRDAWVGAYVAPNAVYVCPVPFVVIRWSR